MKFNTDIHGPQWMRSTDFGDHLTFPYGSQLHLYFVISANKQMIVIKNMVNITLPNIGLLLPS